VIYQLHPITFDGLPARMRAKIVDAASGCWLWQGSIEWHGYGRVKFEGKPQYVHRVVWRLVRGRWPRRDLDHRAELCPHRHCCNPRHLDDVGRGENLRRMWKHGTRPRKAA
jgi:hypothetical protein